jgi:DNA-binding NtrC family response regulator
MRPAAVDVRVIAATHRPIVAMVERGEFRRDLFARLQGFTHRLLPLAERTEDIGLFIADHLRRLAPARAGSVLLSPEAALALVRYPWPNNIRELVHVLTHALALGDQAEVLGLAHLPPAVAATGRMVSPPTVPADSLAPADAALRAELVDHLGRHKGNVAAVARAMGKAPMQIYRWMQRLGVDPSAFR